ncbi:MAG: methylated-DNA--[protein]-cysteine S-methyltransferase [Acidobacteria bacterium]|nr:methylated-DNA--[protein]-cysteine S-methyltransferase [Acidobacteriota bacterium]MCB9399272.1 methylated-DNA--[protein]-cysteine S-methyltransferase [Acidobacteriota bacterium]
MNYLVLSSPIGPLTLASNGKALCAIQFGNPDQRTDGPFDDVLHMTKTQLCEYFQRARHIFELPLEPQGTDFQKQVWRALQHIPYGKTVSYGHLAASIDRPKAVRAVGAANGANPIPIIIPCHRVIGSNGTLTGFGGGLPIKARLLELEGCRDWQPLLPGLT